MIGDSIPHILRCTKYIASERNYFEQFVAEPFEQRLGGDTWCYSAHAKHRVNFHQTTESTSGDAMCPLHLRFLARIQREGEWGDDVEIEAD